MGDIRTLTEWWNVRKNFNIVRTCRGFSRISPSRGNDIESRIFRKFLLFKDSLEVLVLVLRKEKVVVSQLGERLVCSDMENDARAGRREFFCRVFE